MFVRVFLLSVGMDGLFACMHECLFYICIYWCAGWLIGCFL